MPGDLRAKESGLITLTTAGASVTSGSGTLANGTADLDCRSTGNTPDDLQVQFILTAAWATITGLTAGTVIGELYLLPSLDGTNFPEVDLTAGSSRFGYSAFACAFETPKQLVAATSARFASPILNLHPVLYRPYMLFRGGQTVSANWSLVAVSAAGRYT